MTAALFARTIVQFGLTTAALKWTVFGCLMVILVWTDAETRLLPDELTLGGIVVGLGFSLFVPLFDGPIAVGVSDETVSFFDARGLVRVGAGGGDDTEDIAVHEVPLAELNAFLASQRSKGLGIDPKIFAGLFLAGVSLAGVSLPAARGISPGRS